MGRNPPKLVPMSGLYDGVSRPRPKAEALASWLIALCDQVWMSKSRNLELWEKAAEQRERCRKWLLPFMRDNQPKFLTKADLRDAAMRELNVSKSSFDNAWIEAIEQAGRHDWYEPLRRRPRTKT
jgi:hypothetical protein